MNSFATALQGIADALQVKQIHTTQRPLGDLVGQKVQVEGWLDTWRYLPEQECYHILLKDVQISPFSYTDVRVVDHLWVRFEKLEEGFNRYDDMGTHGFVYCYTRLDGSSDFGINPVKSYDLSGRFDLALDYYKQNQPTWTHVERLAWGVEEFSHQLDLLENKETYTPVGVDREKLIDQMRDTVTDLQTRLEVNQRYEANRSHNKRFKQPSAAPAKFSDLLVKPLKGA